MLTHGHYGGGGCAPTRAAGWSSSAATTMPPAVVPEPSLRDEIVTASRNRYGIPLAEVDAALGAALGKRSVSARPIGDEVVTS
jgi:hypothetical protein